MRIRSGIAQEVVSGIKKKASALDGAKEAAQRSVEQSVMRSWDCSQIENDDEEEQRLEEILERRRMQGSSLQLVVHQRMSQGKGVKGFKEKKIVPGWSIVEMKEKPNVAEEEDSEEVKKRRVLSQSEMDQSWKNWVERMEKEILDKYKVEESKREAFSRGASWNGGGCAKTRYTE